jgi:hypothetical protein
LISARPREIGDLSVPGIWEGDLHSGPRNTHVATLLERQFDYLVLVKVAGKGATGANAALKRRVKIPADRTGGLGYVQPWSRDSPAPRLRYRDGGGGVFLRPAVTVAAWHQRERQRTDPPALVRGR